MNEKIHKFEEAGLGKAPFRIVGFSEEKGPKTISSKGGVIIQVGSPGQPMGVCDYCGTAIVNCFHIRSTDDRTFIVGSECVYKTDDKGLTITVRREVNRRKREARHESEAKRIAQVENDLKDSTIIARLRAQRSPSRMNETALEWAEWMMAHSGNSGRMKVVRLIDKIKKDAVKSGAKGGTEDDRSL